jgi:hypothetical protein
MGDEIIVHRVSTNRILASGHGTQGHKPGVTVTVIGLLKENPLREPGVHVRFILTPRTHI